jgi:hypothetical protein
MAAGPVLLLLSASQSPGHLESRYGGGFNYVDETVDAPQGGFLSVAVVWLVDI